MTDMIVTNYFRGRQMEKVNHPSHYGGKDNPYEAIKVMEAWNLGRNLSNTIKYISRADHKGTKLEDLKKAEWYLQREINNLEKMNEVASTETTSGSNST